MVKTKAPLQEKLVLFWHDHFATGVSKVQITELMAQPEPALAPRTARATCGMLVKAINKDPAMMEYLDTVRNEQGHPQRELRPRAAGALHARRQGRARQPDTTPRTTSSRSRAPSRAGATIGDKASRSSTQTHHDFAAEFPERGPKDDLQVDRRLRRRAAWRYAGPRSPYAEGGTEIDTVIDIIFAHTDTDGENTVARRTARASDRVLRPRAEPRRSRFIDDVVDGLGLRHDVGRERRCCARSSCTTTSI